MSKASENISDRELFSELFENPIHPLLINIVPPFVNENSPMFHFQLNGEAVWRWRQVCGQPSTVFELLQSSVLPLGYRLAESARERVGRAFAESIRRFWRKIQDSKNTKKRKQMRAETWLKLGVNPEEMEQTPKDVLAHLMQDNNNLRASVEEKSADLYHKMRQRLAHSENDFTEVGKKQQYRHLTQIQ